MQRRGVAQQFRLVIAHGVRMVVVSNAVMVVCAKSIEGRARAQHGAVGWASVNAKERNAIVAKP